MPYTVLVVDYEGSIRFSRKSVSLEKLLVTLSGALDEGALRIGNVEERLFREQDFRSAILAFEKEYLVRKLRENGCNVSRTAERLGLDRTSIHRKMKQLGITASGRG